MSADGHAPLGAASSETRRLRSPMLPAQASTSAGTLTPRCCCCCCVCVGGGGGGESHGRTGTACLGSHRHVGNQARGRDATVGHLDWGQGGKNGAAEGIACRVEEGKGSGEHVTTPAYVPAARRREGGRRRRSRLGGSGHGGPRPSCWPASCSCGARDGAPPTSPLRAGPLRVTDSSNSGRISWMGRGESRL